MIDDIDEDLVLLQRLRYVVERRRLLAAFDPVEPVRLAPLRPMLERILQPPQFLARDGIGKHQVSVFIPLPGLRFGGTQHAATLL